MTVREPRIATIVKGDYGYWDSSDRRVAVERSAGEPMDIKVRLGDTFAGVELVESDALDLAHAILALFALPAEREPSGSGS